MHGADYFRRWHRRKENSGGLLVHKATPPLRPRELVARERAARASAPPARGASTCRRPPRASGSHGRGERCLDCAEALACPFHLDLRTRKELAAIYLAHEHHDGYQRDRCVFSPEIDIEDATSAVVEYASGAQLAYSLNAFMPYEGYRIAFNGTRGPPRARARGRRPT